MAVEEAIRSQLSVQAPTKTSVRVYERLRSVLNAYGTVDHRDATGGGIVSLDPPVRESLNGRGEEAQQFLSTDLSAFVSTLSLAHQDRVPAGSEILFTLRGDQPGFQGYYILTPEGAGKMEGGVDNLAPIGLEQYSRIESFAEMLARSKVDSRHYRFRRVGPRLG